MITTLHIKNIGIIDDLNIDLGQGFNVLTGETGAGKTLIIDAINIPFNSYKNVNGIPSNIIIPAVIVFCIVLITHISCLNTPL